MNYDSEHPGHLEQPPRGRSWAGLFSLIVVMVVISPALQNWLSQPKDSFPLSYYPMFTANRQESSTITYMQGVDSQGQSRPLHYGLAGKGGLNQVRRQINRMKREGQADNLCAQVADNVARRKSSALRNIVTVRLVTAEYNLDAYFLHGNSTPVMETIIATCAVDRSVNNGPESQSGGEPE